MTPSADSSVGAVACSAGAAVASVPVCSESEPQAARTDNKARASNACMLFGEISKLIVFMAQDFLWYSGTTTEV